MNKYSFLLCSITIWIVFLLFIFNKIYTYHENYSSHIIFVNQNEAYNTITKNKYIDSFNKIDMKVRNCKNIEDCKEKYKNNIILFTEEEKRKLSILTNKANQELKLFQNLYNLPWKFSRVTNKIDNGLPHTHGDTIFLSDKFFDNDNINILIHEKIHVYQKKYPKKTNKLYKLYNYEKLNKITNGKRRANPDLNDFDYKHNGKIIYSEYTDEASSLSDIKLVNSNRDSHQNEHPDEYFAYFITDKILNKNFNEEDNEIINYITY